MNSYIWTNNAAHNTSEIESFLKHELNDTEYEGIVGATDFRIVYENAISVQQLFLRQILKEDLNSYLSKGSIVSLGVAYLRSAIENINRKEGKNVDFSSWNRYAMEYNNLNRILNNMSIKLSKELEGYAIPATSETPTHAVKHVRDYFPSTLSHRFVAEQAGLGWRGKNGLIINPTFSCAVRFTSVLTLKPLVHASPMDSQCGECTACEDVCNFLRYRDILPDYRENCRRYISHLMKKGLTEDVCGKCIKACVDKSLLSDHFKLKS